MSFDCKKGVWVLNCTSPVFVWGACPVTAASSQGFVAACIPAVSGSELLAEESLSESSQI